MKRNVRAVENGAVSEKVAHLSGSNMLLWFTILGILFYLASIFVALADEPATFPINGRTISSAPAFSSSKPRESWFHRMFHKPTWAELLDECKSPRDVCNAVNRFIGYRTEEIDHWTSAEETWQRGRGDCEDFATCIESLCYKLGFSATVNLYFPSTLRGEGHAVVVGNWNGQMWMSSNGSFEVVRSLDEVKEVIGQMYGCSKDELWGTVLAHADIERRLRTDSGPSVAAAVSR